VGPLKNLLWDSGHTAGPFAQGVQVTVKHNELHTLKLMPTRWIIQGSFARLGKNCERKLDASLQFIHSIFRALLLGRS